MLSRVSNSLNRMKKSVFAEKTLILSQLWERPKMEVKSKLVENSWNDLKNSLKITLKMSHLSFSILAFFTNFCPIKIGLSGKLTVLGILPFWAFLINFCRFQIDLSNTLVLTKNNYFYKKVLKKWHYSCYIDTETFIISDKMQNPNKEESESDE